MARSEPETAGKEAGRPASLTSARLCTATPGTTGSGAGSRHNEVRQRGQAGRHLRHPFGHVGFGDDHRGAAVGQLVAEELAPEGDVDRHVDRPEQVGAQPDEDGVEAVVEHRRHPVSGSDAEGGQCAGHGLGPVQRPGPGEFLADHIEKERVAKRGAPLQ